MKINVATALVGIVCLLSSSVLLAKPEDARTDEIRLPPGFTIETLPFSVPNARQMALTDAGTLFIGTRREGVVYAVPKALTAEPASPITIARGLRMPSGVAVHQGDL